jgi:hypothetical protein
LVITITGMVIAVVVGVGIIGVGIRFIVVPQQAASGYGVASDAANRYLLVKGVRDIGSGLIALMLVVVGLPVVVGWYLVVASVMPIGDAVIVGRTEGFPRVALSVHVTTAVVMLAAGVALILT